MNEKSNLVCHSSRTDFLSMEIGYEFCFCLFVVGNLRLWLSWNDTEARLGGARIVFGFASLMGLDRSSC